MGIFGGDSSKSKIFQAGSAIATIVDAPAILLSVECQITRNISPVYTLTDGVLWQAQPPTGTLTAQSILTKDSKLVEKLSKDTCEKAPINIKMKNSCNTGEMNIDIKDGYCSQVTFSLNGQQGYVGTSVMIQFSDCDIIGG